MAMVLFTRVMRIALTSAALMCGAAACFAASPTPKWCSYGFDETDEPAELIFFRNGPTFRWRGKELNLAEEDPFWVEHITFARIDYWAEGTEYHDQEIVIYRDRVFSPCRKG